MDKLEEDKRINSIAIDEVDEEIQNLVDINKIDSEFESDFVSSIEWCQERRISKPKVRDKYHNLYTVPDSYIPSSDIDWSHNANKRLDRKQFSLSKS